MPYMSRKQVGSINSDLIDRVDVARGDVPRTRFVERALEAALGSREGRDAGHDADGPSGSPAAGPSPSPASPRTPVRECEQCHQSVTSPTLKRHACGGRVVPPPGKLVA